MQCIFPSGRFALFTLLTAAPLAVVVAPSAQAQVSATLPPARTYYTDAAGRRAEVNERWGVDASGERHGSYMRFNQVGLVIETATYVHGSKTGPGIYYKNWNGIQNGFLKRPDTRFTGTYKNGIQVGNWLAFSEASNEHVATEIYNEDGALRRRTEFKKGQPVRIEDYDGGGTLKQVTYLENGKARVVTAQQEREQLEQARELRVKKYYEEDNKQRLEKQKYFDERTKAIDEQQAANIAANNRRAAMEKEMAALEEFKELLKRLSFKDANYSRPESFVVSGHGREVLTAIATRVDQLAKMPNPIVYIAVHTPGRPETRGEKKRNFLLSVKRAYAVKSLLLQKLNNKAVSVVTYVCGADTQQAYGNFGVVFSLYQDMPEAHQEADVIAKEFGLPDGAAAVPGDSEKKNIVLANSAL